MQLIFNLGEPAQPDFLHTFFVQDEIARHVFSTGVRNGHLHSKADLLPGTHPAEAGVNRYVLSNDRVAREAGAPGCLWSRKTTLNNRYSPRTYFERPGSDNEPTAHLYYLNGRIGEGTLIVTGDKAKFLRKKIAENRSTYGGLFAGEPVPTTELVLHFLLVGDLRVEAVEEEHHNILRVYAVLPSSVSKRGSLVEYSGCELLAGPFDLDDPATHRNSSAPVPPPAYQAPQLGVKRA